MNQTAYLFDVDGVLSDPVEKRVTEGKLFDELEKRLVQGNPVGLNTGRSISWMNDRIITPLLKRIHDKTILSRFIAIGEKGGTWGSFAAFGNLTHGKDALLAVPQVLVQQVHDLINQKYHESMFFDASKEAMISAEMKDGYNLARFHEAQKALVADLKRLLSETNQSERYKIDPTTIAIDIENRHVGKAFGAKRFLRWLDDKHIVPDIFETFGDSASDFAMSDELHRRGKDVSMIYVGDKTRLSLHEKDYPVLYQGDFSRGTLRYLQHH